MHTDAMKWVSITALLPAAVFRRYPQNHQGELNPAMNAAAPVSCQQNL
jgi:hypothetical protein